MSRIRRILHPSDFSRASAGAFAKAVDMAKTNRAEMLVLHVLVPVLPFVGDGYVSPKLYEEIEASARAQAQKQLNVLVAKAKKAGARAKSLLVEGIPHEQILRAARAKRADVVVLGTHGRTGLARFFVGSVASRVVSMGTCPVLTVRGR